MGGRCAVRCLPRMGQPPVHRRSRCMKLLLLGRNGQVGWELQRSLAPLGELIALDRQGDAGGQGLCGDLSRLDELARTVRALRPDVIVNAAAHTAVDKAESEPDQARLLNALAPQVLAREAAQIGALLVHYSTDYVFDGSGSAARTETEATAPLSVYGSSKLEGEQLIRSEEHTSELQSQSNLVCRLLLEKKKKKAT